jgi:cyclohexyl-isocyanide hydratase
VAAETLHIGMLMYPRLTQLDLTGPFEVLARISGAKVHLLWKTKDPISSDTGMTLVPNTTLADCPDLDIVMVPGGFGQVDLMEDDEVLGFLARQGERAQFVTSVCTGSLVLGAAGLLKGYRAACHWLWRDQLRLFGAEPAIQRVVIDRNRVTGGGVTAGIDFALTLVSVLRGPEAAQRIQLQIEYNPAPPFSAGSPDTAPAKIVADLKERASGIKLIRDEAAARAATKLS